MASLLSSATFVILLLAHATSIESYSLPSPRKASLNRRECLQFLGTTTLATQAFAPPPAEASQYCASGVGDGCESLSEGNALIKSLQEKSAANKEKYAKEALNAYYMKNYPDFFASTGKTMVRKPDGSFMLLEESEIEKLTPRQKADNGNATGHEGTSGGSDAKANPRLEEVNGRG